MLFLSVPYHLEMVQLAKTITHTLNTFMVLIILARKNTFARIEEVGMLLWKQCTVGIIVIPSIQSPDFMVLEQNSVSSAVLFIVLEINPSITCFSSQQKSCTFVQTTKKNTSEQKLSNYPKCIKWNGKHIKRPKGQK